MEQLVDVAVQKTTECDHQAELTQKANNRATLHRTAKNKLSKRLERDTLARKRKLGELPIKPGNMRGPRSELKEQSYNDRTLEGELPRGGVVLYVACLHV